MYAYRPLQDKDLPLICGFPQTPEELFYMSPTAKYPLTSEHIMDKLQDRFQPTVIVERATDQAVAYANLYDVKDETGWLGNVIVAPLHRGRGAAQALLQAMMVQARTIYGLRQLHLSCHNTNSRGLAFYYRLGFVPYDVSIRSLDDGRRMITIQMKRDLTEDDSVLISHDDKQV